MAHHPRQAPQQHGLLRERRGFLPDYPNREPEIAERGGGHRGDGARGSVSTGLLDRVYAGVGLDAGILGLQRYGTIEIQWLREEPL